MKMLPASILQFLCTSVSSKYSSVSDHPMASTLVKTKKCLKGSPLGTHLENKTKQKNTKAHSPALLRHSSFGLLN